MKLNPKTIAGLKEPPVGKSDVIHFDDELPGFGLRIRAGGKRTWIVQYRAHGLTRRMTIGSPDVLGVEAARKAARKALAKALTGDDPQEERQRRRQQAKFSFRSIADSFLDAKQNAVRPRTLVELKRYLTGPYFKPLHSMPIEQITRRDVAERITKMVQQNGAISASRARTTLSTMFAWAMGEGLAEQNPVAGTNRPTEPDSSNRVLSDVELAAVWRACRDDDHGRIVRLLILFGARRQEIGGMCWSEIDLDKGTWTLPAHRSKNHRAHLLPLPPLALDIIKTVSRMISRDQLFGARAKSGYEQWREGKKALDDQLGTLVLPWRLHDLRRTFATRLSDLGTPPHVVENILNHRSGFRRGIVATYNKSRYERETKAALGMWSDHVRALIEGNERKIVAFPATG
jgi:integrase